MGQQIGSTVVIRNVPTVDTGIHAAGDVVAKFDVAPIDRLTGGGRLKNISVFDDSGQTDLLTFLFFDGALTGTYALNGAPALSAADKLLFLGSATFVAGVWKTAGGDSFGCHYCDLCLKHVPEAPGQGAVTAAGPLTVVVLAGATPTWAALALKIALGIAPDHH
jgi:hypothetical protein